jgi:hypothetical protein
MTDDEARWIARAKAGEAAAFRHLVDANSALLFRACARISSGYCLNSACCPEGTTTVCSVDGQVYCANTNTDPNNCRRCGLACESGLTCLGGQCMAPQ